MDLPRELRDRIYYFACGGRRILIVLNSDCTPKRFQSLVDPDGPARMGNLLRVSHAFSTEATASVYQTNTFSFSLHNLYRFCQRVPDPSIKLLTALDLLIFDNVDPLPMNGLIRSCVVARMSGLVRLDIKVRVTPTGTRTPTKILVINEQLHSSVALPLLKCGNLSIELESFTGDPMVEEGLRARLKEIRDLVVGDHVE